ncbi:uncharacterized protein BCR38DRAFT_412142 [Pseudomassariella vexata]|uniref:Uncharacterized protein n=1 Tax=Pseudomassariella vexata TaxID=1141098 RepID=A0A1Y2DKW5_9PEZI|nr:uncharacterized protein BCR38DRAFT_412142 [Pseudomassariella vexata]ORY59920.1 hypothetical protein BCR38DRAFT_412142 [Pseudomassariella vexata]
MACLRDRRCAICRFEIEDRDTIIVEIGDSILEFEFQRYKVFSPPLNIGDDKDKDITIHFCLNAECEFNNQLIPWIHRACRRITRLQVSQDLLAALAFSFSPSVVNRSRRERLLRDDFASHAARGSLWPKELPTELWHLVADHFSLKDYDALVAERLSRKLSTPKETILDLSLPIHVTYRMIDGARYISGLRNRDGPVRTNSIARIETAEDYYGVRQLRFHNGYDILIVPENIIGESTVWWSISSGNQFLRISHDGLKVRRIRPLSPTTDLSSVRVSNPDITPIQIVKLTPDPAFSYSKIWMQQLRCNYPDVIGFFAQLGICGTITIREHFNGIDPQIFHQSQSFPGESRVTIGRMTHADEISVIVSKYDLFK